MAIMNADFEDLMRRMSEGSAGQLMTLADWENFLAFAIRKQHAFERAADQSKGTAERLSAQERALYWHFVAMLTGQIIRDQRTLRELNEERER
jgi:hypothetical protein